MFSDGVVMPNSAARLLVKERVSSEMIDGEMIDGSTIGREITAWQRG